MTSLQGFLYTLFGFLVSIVVLCSGNSTVALSDSVSMDTAKDNKAKPKLSASISMDTAKDSIAKPKSIYHANTVYQDCNNGSCSFADLRIECIDCIPINVSSAVNEIVLSHFNENRIAPHMFCAVSWPRVVNLTMLNSKGNLFHIKNFTFDCLPKIKTLTLGLRLLTNFSHNALYGLEDLQTFDLTDCIRLEIAGLLPGLSSKAIVPKLQTLILSKVGSAYGGVQLSQDFVDILAYRKVTNLDITSSYLGFEDTHVNVDGLCKCVERLNLTNSHLLHLQFVHPATCDSLRVIDVSGVTFPGTPVLPSNITILQAVITIFDSEWTEMLRSVSVIHANNLITHYLFINNVTLSVRVNNSLTEIHFCGNSIPVFELKFKIDPNHVKYFDISNNRIELLSPDSLADLKHLKIIDLSNNSLAVSNQSEYIFASLFRNNSELEIARLTSNGFNDFPSNMFELNTELKQIDLTNNEFNQMPFEMSHLYNLELLNLRGNAIEYLNEWSRHQIDTLYKNKQTETASKSYTVDLRDKTASKSFNVDLRDKTASKSFTLDLRDNPFSCKCHSLDFIKWFVHSHVFDDSRNLYFCEIDGKRLPMNKAAINGATYDCEKPQRELRNHLLIILLPCTLTLILVVMAIVFCKRNKLYSRLKEQINIYFKRYKRNRLYSKLKDQIDMIHENRLRYSFPVFLSYASNDGAFVQTNILQPLEAQLKNMTNCDRDLVAIGDCYFRLGLTIFSEIIRMLDDCAVFVVVLSKNYCFSDYCKHEIEQARLMRKPIVIIMKEFVDEDDMNCVIKETFKHFTRATFRLEEEGWRLEQDWEYICQSIIQLL